MTRSASHPILCLRPITGHGCARLAREFGSASDLEDCIGRDLLPTRCAHVVERSPVWHECPVRVATARSACDMSAHASISEVAVWRFKICSHIPCLSKTGEAIGRVVPVALGGGHARISTSMPSPAVSVPIGQPYPRPLCHAPTMRAWPIPRG